MKRLPFLSIFIPTLLRFTSSLLLTTFLTMSANAQDINNPEGLKEVKVTRVATAPVLDGNLDDAVWQQAEVIDDFHQISPGDGTEPSEPTEVYMIYTEDALYIGARMYDSNPELIAAPVIRHNQGLPGDDRLVIILDPFNTRRVGYRFETNLNGVRHDALYDNVTSFTGDWVAIWDVATDTFDEGWIAEIEIPFKTLPFDPNIDTWGFNFGRGIRRRNEEMAWVSYNRSYNPSIVGLATGLEGMDQGVGLDIVPTFTMNERRTFNPGDKESDFDPSLDMFYRLTPSLNAALTVNTDFSAADVDNRQVNLTRFNLFFPERRDFFLNDADLFQFGNISNTASSNQAGARGTRENARPYFSRNIGIGANGEEVDLKYGGRVSGRVGRWNIGTLAVRQDASLTVDASDLFVGRLSANVLDESTLGFIVTDGDPQSNLDNTVYGADFRYLNTQLASGRQIEGNAWYQKSDTPGLDNDNASWGVNVSSPNNSGLRGEIGIKEVQQNFNPALGFVNRTNVRDYSGRIGYTHFFNSDLWQQSYTGLDVFRGEVINGGLQSEVLKFRFLEAETNSRDSFDMGHTRYREEVLAPFTIYSEPSRAVIIPAGSYEYQTYDISLGTGNQREFSTDIRIEAGEFYNGDSTGAFTSFNWNQSRNFAMSINYDWNDVSLPQGDFTARLTSVNTQVAFTTNLYWISLLQYDNISENMGLNTRIQWIPEAGQEALIVLNYNMQDQDKDNRFRSTLSDISVRFRYTFRY
ncbi:MAG: carbohydrate binding family 9 domain-containing protein [Gammaproteobacteria bacterium]|jgi:hypothetical protein|nr:carbohydrate binding family 9 domain-containing protein [Gammaproteobacteria bacterium]